MEKWVENVGTELVLIEAYCLLKLNKDTIEVRNKLAGLNEQKIMNAPEFYQKLAEEIDQALTAKEVVSEYEPDEVEVTLKESIVLLQDANPVDE